MIGKRGAAFRLFSRPILAPPETVSRHDDDGRVARQNVRPLADETIDFRVIVGDRGPIFSIAVLTDTFAIRRMVRAEEMIDGVRSFEGNHQQQRIMSTLSLVVVKID